MQEKVINGVKIVTNYDKHKRYSLCDGNNKKDYRIRVKEVTETEDEFIQRLVNIGYRRIMLKRGTTTIRGFYKLIAYVR